MTSQVATLTVGAICSKVGPSPVEEAGNDLLDGMTILPPKCPVSESLRAALRSWNKRQAASNTVNVVDVPSLADHLELWLTNEGWPFNDIQSGEVQLSHASAVQELVEDIVRLTID